MKLTIIGRSFPGRTLLLVLVSLAAGYGLRGACAPATTGGGMATHGDHAPAPSTTWSCSMHPQVHSPDPGACPTCGMDLVEVSADQQGTGERQIVLDPAAVALAEIATTRVERRFPTAVLRMAGSLTYDETRRRTINAWVGGRLERLFVDFEGLSLRAGDHVADLDRLLSETGHPPVYANRLEPHPGAELIDAGWTLDLGSLSLRALLTSGHSVGGTSYLVNGLAQPVVVVGDALFAGSMGGGVTSFTDALRNNREKLMNLPDDTIVCPGHGPISTIAEEKKANPFFPEFKW